ncbi:replication-relaxation family protein [Bacillus sp. Au-Bac7]|uniref:replication-relaxation family protein n=1 Tax=Bacillus sp. Au-Bac7 TaxID=2906458 RepID=UPI001E45A588|nr:replication-relaxation family protein [Bacillus sp. Au-Bac7]MCE4051878.1 replication-relaxation family protein [Bacillus sp. Au-Bac7]
MKKRDLAILKSLQTFTFLSTEQICELHFNNLTYPRVNANRVLNRMRLRPNSEIAAITDRSFQSYIYYLKDSKVKSNSQKRDHYLEIASTHIAMNKYSHVSNLKVEEKIPGAEEFRPDIACTWLDNDWIIEVQNSLFSRKQLETKLSAYQKWYKSGQWKEVYKEFPNILIVGHINSKFDKSIYDFTIEWVNKISDLEPAIAYFKASEKKKVTKEAIAVKTPNKPNITVSQPIKSNGGITYRLN